MEKGQFNQKSIERCAQGLPSVVKTIVKTRYRSLGVLFQQSSIIVVHPITAKIYKKKWGAKWGWTLYKKYTFCTFGEKYDYTKFSK